MSSPANMTPGCLCDVIAIGAHNSICEQQHPGRSVHRRGPCPVSTETITNEHKRAQIHPRGRPLLGFNATPFHLRLKEIFD